MPCNTWWSKGHIDGCVVKCDSTAMSNNLHTVRPNSNAVGRDSNAVRRDLYFVRSDPYFVRSDLYAVRSEVYVSRDEARQSQADAAMYDGYVIHNSIQTRSATVLLFFSNPEMAPMIMYGIARPKQAIDIFCNKF